MKAGGRKQDQVAQAKSNSRINKVQEQQKQQDQQKLGPQDRISKSRSNKSCSKSSEAAGPVSNRSSK
jgi:hypothetical protein